MHVLIVPSWYPTSEAPLDGIYFAEQARCLHQNGLQIGVVYPEQQSLRRASWSALREKHFQTEWGDANDLPTLRRYSWNVWWKYPPGIRRRTQSAVRLAEQYVDRYGLPDLIHAQSGRWAGAAAARMGRQFSIPYVLTEHYSGFSRGGMFPWRWPLVEEGYRDAAQITAVSSSLKRSLIDHGLARPSEVEVHPNLVSPSLFSPPPAGRSSLSPFRFVTVARLDAQKNVSQLLRSFALLEQTQEAFLTVVGDGPERPVLEQQARQLGIADHVVFRGSLDRKAVRDALRRAHAFVLPSRYETFGVVLLEAMATGLPVIATASGGPEDIVTPDTGILVPPEDPHALANALLRMKTSWSSYDADTIRRRTLRRYGPEPFVRRTRLLYRRALDQTP